MLPEKLGRIDSAGCRGTGGLEFERLVQTDMEPETREQGSHLPDPVLQNGIGLGMFWVEIHSMRQHSHAGVAFEAEEIVEMAVVFQAGHYIYVALAGIFDNAAHFVLAVTAAAVDERVALQLNRSLGIEVILVRLPAC